jgi:hypothetical protein
MLLKKDYTEGEVVTFKLVNGDEILARVVATDPDSWTVSKPLTIESREKGLGLLQTIMSMDMKDPVVLQKSSVMIHTATVNELANHYIKTTAEIQPVTTESTTTGE